MSQESKHADLLNVLDAMAGNMHYAVRRQELRQAEQLIVEQEARLAECERERDWAQLLARAVLGCSISTYEACDQTIGIFSRTQMLWADWDGIGESDAKSSLPKETPELRAAIEAAIKVPEGVEDAQGLRTQLVECEAEVRELREEITRLRAAGTCGHRQPAEGAVPKPTAPGTAPPASGDSSAAQ
jgi:hypothetical protein